MTYREARCAFTLALAKLILWAFEQGYEVAVDEVTERLTERDPTSDHMVGSLHHLGLAADLNLYKGGIYQRASDDHEPLGRFWEQYGKELGLPLAWGGHFGDGNHYSLSWGGRK